MTVWHDQLLGGTFRAQRFDATGKKPGTGFSFNAGSDNELDIALLGDWRFIITYTETSSGDDDIEFVIYGPRDGNNNPIQGTSDADNITSRTLGAFINGLVAYKTPSRAETITPTL